MKYIAKALEWAGLLRFGLLVLGKLIELVLEVEAKLSPAENSSKVEAIAKKLKKAISDINEVLDSIGAPKE